ncbi:MAG: flagellar basal body-associated FliL family protein [Gallionella sp.]|nr:flagellar basal body-associated FliL family protein [Gallionella sp.]
MSKPAKPAAAAVIAPADDQPPKSKKKLIIIIIAVVVLLTVVVAAAGYFLVFKKGNEPKDGHAAASEEVPAKFVDIGTFTANLVHEDSDRVMQVAISLKLSKPELEEKVKGSSPEIQHKVNMLLQSKRPSELATVEGKEKLADEIKTQVEFILGLRKSAPAIHTAKPATEGDAPASAVAQTKPAESPSQKGVAEVLFTSFIIQ